MREENIRDRAEALCENIATTRGMHALKKDVKAGRFGQMTPYAEVWLRRQAMAPAIRDLWSFLVGAATIGALVVACRSA
jgi:hypothetical protein